MSDMNRPSNTTWMIALLAAALLVPSLGTAVAQGQSPQYHERTNRYELSNAAVTVWFQQKKPMLRIFDTGNASRSYQLHLMRIVEFRDANGDHAYNRSEEVAFLNLDQAKGWNVSVTQGNGSLAFTLTTQGRIRTVGPLGNLTSRNPLGSPPTANVTLVFHITSSQESLPGGNNTTVTLTSSEVKFDVLVDGWSWVNPQGDQLAIVGSMPVGGNATVNATGGALDISANGSRVGSVAWAPTAQVTTGNRTSTADVVPSFQAPGSGNGSALVAWAVNATGYSALRYDPTMAIQSASTSSAGNGTSGSGSSGGFSSALRNVPAPGAALALSAGVLAAVVVLRRRR